MKINLHSALKVTVSHLKKEIFSAELKRKPLVFSYENSKLKDTYTFSLPSGWTCPGACKCLAKADRFTGKLTNGPEQVYRCFSASQEAAYPSLREIRWHNFDQLKLAGSVDAMVNLIMESLPKDAKVIRLHVSGDYFNQAYFDAWLEVAYRNPEIIFYAYTKSINFWQNQRYAIPSNLRLNASVGGKHDNIIFATGLKSATVVMNEDEATKLGLEVDHDDSHAWKQDKSFALIVHGTQTPGTEASKAWAAQMKKIKSQPKRKIIKRKPATIEYLTNQIVRLAQRFASVLTTPKYVVKVPVHSAKQV